MNTAQAFVDALNKQTMPAMGYHWRNGRWEWPSLAAGQWQLPNGEPTGEKYTHFSVLGDSKRNATSPARG